MSIVDRIEKLIEASGLEQGEFAQGSALGEDRLRQVLNGRRRVSSLDLAKIAEYCRVTVDWLITGKDPWGDLKINLCRLPTDT